MSVILSSSVPRVTLKTFPLQGDADQLYINFTSSTKLIRISEYLAHVQKKLCETHAERHAPFLGHFFPGMTLSYTPDDEIEALLYVLTNTDLYEGDPRVEFVETLKLLPPVEDASNALLAGIQTIQAFTRAPGWDAPCGGALERFVSGSTLGSPRVE